MFFFILTVLSVLFCGVFVISEGRHHKYDDFERMGEYELIEFDYNSRDSTLTMVSFFAFGEYYKLYLELNIKLVGNDIFDNNGVPDSTLGYFTSLTQSCHYHINGNLSNGIIGGISICDKRGLRGRIHTNNDTLIIMPANYYLNTSFDQSDELWHDISDIHLVYRMSDYNDDNGILTDIEQPETGYQKRQTKSRSLLDIDLINGGIQNTELFIVIAVALYEDFYNEYGATMYYEELVSWVADTVHYVNSDYQNTNWGPEVGTIYIGLTQIEVITSYTDEYADLEPTELTADGGISMGAVLRSFGYWIANDTFHNESDFDHAIFLSSDVYGLGYLGLGGISSMCLQDGDSTSLTRITGGYIVTMSHELGHSFSGSHDQSFPECGNNGGIMGYGYNDWSFSDCTIDSVSDYFINSCPNDCQCLGNDIRWIDDYDESTVNSCEKIYDCVEISNIYPFYSHYYSEYYSDTIDLNSVFSYEGCYFGFPYYKSVNPENELYLYYSINGYRIFFAKSENNYFGWCEGNDISDCSNKWNIYDTQNLVIDESVTTVWSGNTCSSSTTTSTPVSNDHGCILISNLAAGSDSDTDLSGVYEYTGDVYGYPMYWCVINNTNWYLYYEPIPGWEGYAISRTTAGRHAIALCHSNDPTDCDGINQEWEVYIDSWGYYDDNGNCEYMACIEDCILIANLAVDDDLDDVSGVYVYNGDINGYPMYETVIEGVNWYLYYEPQSNWIGYAIGTATSNPNQHGWAYCPFTDPTECDGTNNEWQVYIDSWDYYDDDGSCQYMECA